MPDLPYGFDRADGVTELPGGGTLGTATPSGAILVGGYGSPTNIDEIAIEELPESPDIERAEQATITKHFRMGWTEALNRIAFLGRGSVVTDSADNMYLILSSSLRHEQGGTGVLTVTMEAKTFDSPPDEFSITPVELGINIIKHPRYFYAFLGDGAGSTTEQQNQMVIRLLQDYMENPSANYRNAIVQLLNDSLGYADGNGFAPQPPRWDRANEEYEDNSSAFVTGSDMAKRAALEIIQKYWRGEETPYLVGYEISWAQYYFVCPAINPGGYVEDPMTEANPGLPDYFYSRMFPPDPAYTIFDLMPAYNPQCYSDTGEDTGSVNISWMRKSDQIDYQRTWFKITRTWIGSPVGFWDTELYTQQPRPSTSAEYLTIYNP